jgi:RNA polymerase sigma factor (sigma-70 family)
MISDSKRSFMTAIERSHGQQLRRFLSLRLRRSMDVPDLIQEIYLRLLRIKDHEAIRNPQAYLYTVASHVLHQYNLKRSTRPEALDPLGVASEYPAAAPDPADQLDIEQRLQAVGRGLEQLSPRAYAALVMYRCEGMTLMEIGQRLGVSHVMARKYLARAIAYCDEHMERKELS